MFKWSSIKEVRGISVLKSKNGLFIQEIMFKDAYGKDIISSKERAGSASGDLRMPILTYE